MESKVVGYCAVAAILGIIAAATGFAAEATKVKASEVYIGVASVVGVALLFTAAGLNNRQGGQVNTYGYIFCYVVKPGIFAAGAILALLSAVFGIAAYLTLNPPPQTATNNPVAAYPMGTMNVDLEKNPVPFPPQQYPTPPQQYPPQQYPPQQH